MPEFITTQPRITDLGKPRGIPGGFREPEGANPGEPGTDTVLFEPYNQHRSKPLPYQTAMSASKTNFTAFAFRRPFSYGKSFYFPSGQRPGTGFRNTITPFSWLNQCSFYRIKQQAYDRPS